MCQKFSQSHQKDSSASEHQPLGLRQHDLVGDLLPEREVQVVERGRGGRPLPVESGVTRRGIDICALKRFMCSQGAKVESKSLIEDYLVS